MPIFRAASYVHLPSPIPGGERDIGLGGEIRVGRHSSGEEADAEAVLLALEGEHLDGGREMVSELDAGIPPEEGTEVLHQAESPSLIVPRSRWQAHGPRRR